MRKQTRNRQSIFRNTLLGAAGGLTGWAAMRLYWSVAEALPGPNPRTLSAPADKTLDEQSVAEQQRRAREKATEESIRMAEGAARKSSTSEAHPKVSYSPHWGYGLVMGGVYGALRGTQPGCKAGSGLFFGAALWAVADEVLLPLMGKRRGRSEAPVLHHLHRLGSHLAFGAATAAATQKITEATRPPTRRERVARLLQDQWEMATSFARDKFAETADGRAWLPWRRSNGGS